MSNLADGKSRVTGGALHTVYVRARTPFVDQGKVGCRVSGMLSPLAQQRARAAQHLCMSIILAARVVPRLVGVVILRQSSIQSGPGGSFMGVLKI
eukprot:1158402-Pelagomonas_calceolata.AAC.14